MHSLLNLFAKSLLSILSYLYSFDLQVYSFRKRHILYHDRENIWLKAVEQIGMCASPPGHIYVVRLIALQEVPSKFMRPKGAHNF